MQLEHDDLNNLRTASNIILGFETEDEKRNKNLFRGILPDDDLKNSLDNYRSAGHYDINNVFRGLIKGSRITEELRNDISNLQKAMKIVKPFRYNKGEFIVWRGIDLSKDEYHPDKRRYYHEIMDLNRNGTSNNPAFLSTTYDKDVALTFTDCCLFKIHVDPQEDLEYILIDIMGEKEILFQDTTYFRWIREYSERDEESEKDYRVFEVSLHRGTIVKEYTYTEKVVLSDKDLYNQIIGRISDSIDQATVNSLRDDFEWNLEETQEDLYNDFLKNMQKSYPDDFKNIKKFEPDLKKEVYSFVEKLYNLIGD